MSMELEMALRRIAAEERALGMRNPEGFYRDARLAASVAITEKVDPDVIGLITALASDYGVSYLAASISVCAFIDDYIAAAERERDPDVAEFCRPEPRGPWPNMYRDGLD